MLAMANEPSRRQPRRQQLPPPPPPEEQQQQRRRRVIPPRRRDGLDGLDVPVAKRPRTGGKQGQPAGGAGPSKNKPPNASDAKKASSSSSTADVYTIKSSKPPANKTPKTKPKAKPPAAKKAAPKPTRNLFDLLRKSSWDSALRRLSTHPQDAAYSAKRAYHERWDCSRDERDAPSRHQASAMAGRHPGEAYWRVESGYTSLHMAILKGAPAAVIGAVMTAHPSGVCEVGKVDLKAPLHVCIEIPSRIERGVVEAFVERYPPRASWLGLTIGLPIDLAGIVLSYVPHPALQRDIRGQTPLHKMCKRRSRMSDCTALLANSCPRALRLTDRKGWTPLHAFLFGRSPPPLAPYVRLFGQLADLAGSEVLDRVDPGGVTPLHIACLSLQRSEVLRSILRRSPSCASIKGCHGVLPLHLLIVRASRSNAEVGPRTKFLSVIRDLARSDPGCLRGPIPPYQFSLLDFVLPAGGEVADVAAAAAARTPIYRGPLGREVAEILRTIDGDHRAAATNVGLDGRISAYIRNAMREVDEGRSEEHTDEGVGIDYLNRRFEGEFSEVEIRASLDRLVGEGTIFSTVDEETFRPESVPVA